MKQQTNIIHSLTKEEQDLLGFTDAMDYSTRLQQYREHPRALATRTTPSNSHTHLSTTKTFRCCLQRFIRRFQPEPLWPDHDRWLHLEPNGRFSLRLGENGEEVTNVSEGDFFAFQFTCFLHLRRFWSEVRMRYRYPSATLPILMPNFPERSDEGGEYESLLQRAASVGSVVIVPK